LQRHYLSQYSEVPVQWDLFWNLKADNYTIILSQGFSFGEEGVPTHKTMTLHVNVLYKGREAANSGTPCWFPVFLLLIRSLWREITPEYISWEESCSAFPHSPMFSAESAACTVEVDY
jgi:hypothetical protein